MRMTTSKGGTMTVPPPRSDASTSHAHVHDLDPLTRKKNTAPDLRLAGLFELILTWAEIANGNLTVLVTKIDLVHATNIH